jgi:hypothetical protein
LRDIWYICCLYCRAFSCGGFTCGSDCFPAVSKELSASKTPSYKKGSSWLFWVSSLFSFRREL